MKSEQKPKSKPSQSEARPSVGIDDIITISRQDGKPKAEMKKLSIEPKPADVIEVPKEKQVMKLKLPEPIISKKRPMQAKEKPTPAVIAKPAPSKPKIEKPEPVQEEYRQDVTTLGDSKLALAEAALFLSSKPLMIDELAKIMGVNSLGYVKETLEKLKGCYAGRGIEVASTSSGWTMQVRPEYLGSVAHLAPYADLSEGPKRALALILFKEPMKQSDLIKMQGNKVYDYLRVLEKMGMVKREPSGRTKTLTLTREFESYFGEDKEKIRQKLEQELASNPVEMKPAEKAMSKEALKKLSIGLEFSRDD